MDGRSDPTPRVAAALLVGLAWLPACEDDAVAPADA
jgi:hypothetical protein